jgi:hypothetical protein
MRQEIAAADGLRCSLFRELLIEAIARIEFAQGDCRSLAIGFVVSRVLDRHARAGVDQEDECAPHSRLEGEYDHRAKQNEQQETTRRRCEAR